MSDQQRLTALRQGAEKGAAYVAIKREDLLWLLDQADKKTPAKSASVETNKQSESAS